MAKILSFAFSLFILYSSCRAAEADTAEARPLVIPLAAANVSLDPRLVTDQSSLWISRQINCQLVRYDGAEVVNEAAQSVTYQTPDRLEIKLKDGLTFTDGTPVTAEDVAATFSYLKNSRRVHRNVFDWVQSIQVQSSRGIVIQLKNAMPQFLKTLASPLHAIYPASFIKRVAENPSQWRSPVGCGGYRLSRRLKDQEGRTIIELVPVHRGLRPIHFVLTASAQVRADTVERYDIIGLPVIGDTAFTGRDYKTVELFDPYQIFFAINTKIGPWTNHENRCHLLAAIDPQSIAKAYGGLAETPTDWFPRGILGYSGPRSYSSTVDPDSSRKLSGLLERANRRFCLAFLSVSIPESIRPSYEALFRNVFPSLQSRVLFNTKAFGREFKDSGCDGIVFGLKSGYLDGYEYLQFVTEKEANVTNWSDPKLIGEIKASQDIADSAQRSGAYRLIAEEVEHECLAKPLVSIPRRKVYLRSSLNVPDIGKVALNAYYLGAVR